MPLLYWYLLIINVMTFCVRGYDKHMARINGNRLEKAGATRESQDGVSRHERVATRSRVSEKNLLILALIGGGVGALCAMSFFRHKTKKGSFLWKLLVILCIQIGVVVFLLSQ